MPLRKPFAFIAVVLALLGGSAPSAAQEPGADLRIYLMTFSPGSIIYERFGHNTICIHDPNPSPERIAERVAFERRWGGKAPPAPPFNTTDRAHHYGAFDFEQEGFIPRFVMGRMEYWTTSDWADLTALTYAAEGRGVLLQELNLEPAEKLAVKTFLEWNERPENRSYRYDYYRDNCSTRVRDVIDLATGGQLRRQLQATQTGTTFRSHTRRLTSGLDPLDVYWFTAFTYVLGHPVDEPLTAWDECFLPGKLADHVRSLRLDDGRPLVAGELAFSTAKFGDTMPAQAPTRRAGYAVAGLLIGGTFFALAWVSRRSRLSRIAFALVIAISALFWGIGGSIAANGWAFTDHAASYRNENLLQASPLILPLVVLGPMLVTRRKRGSRFALVLAITIASGSVLGLVLKVFPAFWQHNAEILALMIPANLGLATAVWILARHAAFPEKQSNEHNTMNSPRTAAVAASILSLILLGCGGGGEKAGKAGDPSRPYIEPPQAKEAPKAPPAQRVALDPSLLMSARQEVKDALRDSDSVVRQQGLESLRGMNDADAAQEIIHALNDKSIGVRFAAAMMAGELKIRSAQKPLERMLRETEPNVGVAVRFALHKLGNTRHTQDLVKFAASADPRVRGNVALVLGLLGEKSAINKILRTMQQDPDPLVRQQALEAAWRLGDEAALKPLVGLTVSRYSDDRIIGLLALAGPKRQTVREHVRGLLAGDDVHMEVSLVAARAMGMLGSDEGYAIAQAGAKSKDPQHRFLAAVAFGAIGRTDAQDELRRLLSDSEPNVQLAAASALLQLNKKA